MLPHTNVSWALEDKHKMLDVEVENVLIPVDVLPIRPVQEFRSKSFYTNRRVMRTQTCKLNKVFSVLTEGAGDGVWWLTGAPTPGQTPH